MEPRTRRDALVIRGDILVDWNIAEDASRASESWSPDKRMLLWHSRGGALLIADLLKIMLDKSQGGSREAYEIHAPTLSLADIAPGDPRFHHACSLLAPFGKKGKRVWRVSRFLGLERRAAGSPSLELAEDPSGIRLLLLDDANLGFRDDPDLWSGLVKDLAPGAWILLKQSAPIAKGRLWDYLIRNHSDRLITVTTIDDLRRSEVQVSRQISWERTAQDVFWELIHNPRVNSLSRSVYTVISLNAAGAILLSNLTVGEPHAQLLFDPHHMECDWEAPFSGSMYGFTTCVAAAVADALMAEADEPDLIPALQAGVRGMRSLLEEGFGTGDLSDDEDGMQFPFDPIVSAYAESRDLLAVSPIQNPVGNLIDPAISESPRVMAGYWTILEDRYRRDLGWIAQRIVLDGIDATLQDVPIGRFGALNTVDRREIEALRGIRTLISEYALRPQGRPLSIAVFGPPGSGKSFAVKQIAKSTAPGEIQSITFNISQFDQPEALLDALHQVRDIALSGSIPLVFWDEFDTPFDGKPLGWLRYFLAPMQDGSFQEGQVTHPIGKSIFVFAGGTSHRMQVFGEGLQEGERRAAKLPDFVSRLKGYIDILGPNPIEGLDDPYYIIRRAIILRVLFEMHVPQIIAPHNGTRRVRIDSGILRAFLETSRYKHGVRSIETLLTMSTLADADSFDRSCLPPEDQLNLHVDGTDFLARVQHLDLEGELLETLAKAAQEVFCEALIEQGYSYGAETDTEKKTHRALMPYQDLDEALKESNRANVRDIPGKLAAAGYVMLPARSNEPPFNFPGPDLEKLAQMEHARWNKALRDAGWRHAPRTDPDRKEHASLVAWGDLSEGEREKDRQMVRSIPRILARAGYAVVRSPQQS